MAEILEKEQFFELHVLKFLLVCREDYCFEGRLAIGQISWGTPPERE